MYHVLPHPFCLSIQNYLTEFDNSVVGEEETFHLRHVWAAVTDWQVSRTRPRVVHVVVYHARPGLMRRYLCPLSDLVSISSIRAM